MRLGALVSFFVQPVQTRMVTEGPIRHEIGMTNVVIHAIGTGGASFSNPVVHIACGDAAMLTKFLTTALPYFFPMERTGLNYSANKLLEAVTLRQHDDIVDLSHVAGWNSPFARNSDGIEAWIIGRDFIPPGLEFAKVWVRFTIEPSGGSSSGRSPRQVMEDFYSQLVNFARSFDPSKSLFT